MIETIARDEARARAQTARSVRVGLAIVDATSTSEPLAAWRAWALLCAAIEAGDEDAAVSLGALLVDVLAASSPLSRLDVERAILNATGAP